MAQEFKLVPVEIEEDEIEFDLIYLLNTLWKNRLTIIKFISIAILIGLYTAVFSQKEYEASATLMPEYSTDSQTGASSLLQQYGGLLGLSSGSYSANSNAIRVDLYPKVVESLTFQRNLINQDFYFSLYDTTVTIFEFFTEVKDPDIIYLTKAYTYKLPLTILSLIISQDSKEAQPLPDTNDTSSAKVEEPTIVSLSQLESEIISGTKDRVTVSLDMETGIVSVSVLMPDPMAAAQIVEFTIQELTEYLVEYRTEKVLTDLKFIEEQLGIAELRFEEIQIELAEFRDSNQGRLTARARTEEQRLNSEYDIAFNLKNSLTQRYEDAKLKVQEETPVFKVLEPAWVPLEEVQPRRALIMIVYTFLGGFLSIVWIFGKIVWDTQKTKIFKD